MMSQDTPAQLSGVHPSPTRPSATRPSATRRMHPSYRAAAWLLTITLGISGCQVLNDLASATSEENNAPAVLPMTEHASAADTSVQSAAAPTAAPVIDSNPNQFLGLQGDMVAARLGAPDLIRRDGTAEVRQFRGAACVLDLFLYPDQNILSVKHVELRGASLKQEDRNACLSDLIRARIVTG